MHSSPAVSAFRFRVDSVLDRVALGRTGASIGAAATAFAALLFPSACVVCGRWDTSLCRGCSRRFRSATARPYRAEGAAEALPDVVVPPTSLSRSAQRTVAAVGDDGPTAPDGYEPLPVLAAGR